MHFMIFLTRSEIGFPFFRPTTTIFPSQVLKAYNDFEESNIDYLQGSDYGLMFFVSLYKFPLIIKWDYLVTFSNTFSYLTW